MHHASNTTKQKWNKADYFIADCGLARMCCLVYNIGIFKQPGAPKRRNLEASSSNKIAGILQKFY